ncbi:MAG: allantoinase AllB [Archangium sp.]|nr:allantoinase AllB [Archangium sp.]MDP3155862.1 allantoinase AllB [Archangium sp.]MDP3575428.1 allantoinase AllB [Archangium sp.]
MKVFRSKRVVTPEGIRPATVHVRGEIIDAIADYEAIPAGYECIDAGEAVLMPGVVDTHVHVNEPGRTEWEGFLTATRAAASGGVTTLVDMPLNAIPPTTTAEALRKKRQEAAGQCLIDVGFWGGVVPGNTRELEGLVREGARGFKAFMCYSGVEEFPGVQEEHLQPAMMELRRLSRPLLVHAEVEAPIDAVAEQVKGMDPRSYMTYLASRPPTAEEDAIKLVSRLCRETRARTHIVHHSAATALPLIRAARAEGLPFTAETCPHYLHFAAEDIRDGATAFKCAPPIRERSNRELLWAALGEGVLELVASDHSPCTPALKKQELGDFMAAWGGISGLQLGLSVTWSGASARGFTLQQVVKWMCEAPARLAGLEHKKGRIAPGFDADLVIFEPEAKFQVDLARLQHKHKLTPYADAGLTGVVTSTYVRGQRVFHQGEHARELKGQFL